MTRLAALVLVLALGLVPRVASADSIGPCPDGQRIVENPTPPGSMHHGGFHCEPDPNASRCSALPGVESEGALALAGLGLAALVIALRRR
jgi:MYXO-CTERM domain-containing protein